MRYSSEQFGEFSEGIARFFGTARFLAMQTVIVVLWIGFNIVWGLNIGDIRKGGFDPYPFILLNLAFSTQAAYAAPLILLAQNRQERRDRTTTDNDRRMAERTQADTEFLARELAGMRLAIGDVVTSDELDDRLEKLLKAVERLTERIEAMEQPATQAE